MLFPLYSAGFTATLLHILNDGFNAPDTLFEKHTSFIILAFAFLFPVGASHSFFQITVQSVAAFSDMLSVIYVIPFVFESPGLWVQKQRQYGRARVWPHVLLQTAGVASLWVSAAAIWANKDEKSKPHLATYHSWLGATVAVLLTLQLIARHGGQTRGKSLPA